MHKETVNLPIAVLMKAPIGLIALDFSGKIIICNSKATQLLGNNQSQEALVGRQLATLMEGPQEVVTWLEMLVSHQPMKQKKIVRVNTGTYIQIISRTYEHGLILSLQRTISPITLNNLPETSFHPADSPPEQHTPHTELDQLTQLPNRTYFIKQASASIKSLAANQSVTLIFVDLKDFNQINETLGHQAGDELLRYISIRLQAFCEISRNLHARMGGDKFCILYVNQTKGDITDTQPDYMRKLHDCFCLPAPISGFTATVAISIGLSNYPGDALNFTDLLKCADLACKASKKQGGLVSYDDSLNTTLGRYRLKLAHNVKSALLNDEFIIYLQPQVHIRRKQITTCEALIRWIHPEYGLIMPHDFVPMIEKSPLIHDLLFDILEKAIKIIVAFKDQIQISINVSPRNLFTPDLITKIEYLLNKHQASPKNLCFELTETALMNTGASTRNILFELQKLGIILSLDDYGTGFSSLSHIQSLPIDQIKIDRSFVANMHISEKDRIIVNSTIQLAKNLGLQVVAEGIELQVHMQMLQEMGCDIAQGYFISRPCPAAEAWAFISDYN